MRFSNKSNSNSYIAAGQAAARQASNAFVAARKHSPDYGKLAEESIKTRSAERRAAYKAEAAITKAGIDAKQQVKRTKIKTEAEAAVQDTKMGAKRMAGIIGGLGTIAVAGMQMAAPKDEEDKGWKDKYHKMEMELLNKQIAALDKPDREYTPYERAEFEYEGGSDSKGGTKGDTKGGTGSTGSKGTKAKGGSATGLRLMQDLINDGYKPIQAAAIAGNAQHESADFTAHEEFAPNSYGTKGVGFIQWTNSRRGEFESWVKSQNLDPKSYEASAGYLKHEMAGGKHWTGAGAKGFNSATDLQTATTAYMNDYLRPHKDHQHLDRRLSNAQSLYDAWNSQNK